MRSEKQTAARLAQRSSRELLPVAEFALPVVANGNERRAAVLRVLEVVEVARLHSEPS